MNEALELAGRLDDYSRGDEYQRVTEEAAAMLRSQAAEIEGWKKDQKENLRNQCDLHAEIERLKADANTCGSGAGCLHKEATIDSQAAEIEILKQGERDGLRKVAQMALEWFDWLNATTGPISPPHVAKDVQNALREELSE